jgi:glycosyltransferase involved in cell wall biosynthesis
MVAYALYLNDARIKAYVKTLERAGVKVDVLVVGETGKPRVEWIGSTRIVRLTRQYRGSNALRYLWSYLQFFVFSLITVSYLSCRRRYMAVHVHNMPNALVFAVLLPRLLGAKIILDVHDLMTANYMAKFQVDDHHLMVRVLRFEQWVSSLAATHVFCADHSQREYLVACCGIAARKVTVIMNLPNEEIFKAVPSTTDGKTLKIVYHGTITRRLGIDLIIRAVSRAADTIPVELWIYGAGEFLDEARQLASELHLQNTVRFNGNFFPVERIPEIVAGMDVGVIGNRRNLACERFMLPVKLLEYVYLGVPVIAPRLEIIARYFDDSMVAYYQPENVDHMAAWMVRLFRHPEQRRQLAAAAFRFYEQRNWSAQAEEYVALVSRPSDWHGPAEFEGLTQ